MRDADFSNSRPNFNEVGIRPHFRYAVAFLLMGAWACLSLPQEAPQRAVSTKAAQTLSRTVVPDVRGQRPEDAQKVLKRAGLQPGKTSANPGPGIVGTVQQQEPVQNSVAPMGAPIKLVVVAPPVKQNPNHNDNSFFTQVPRLIGLTPNQASNVLERSRLLLGNISTAKVTGPAGTIYDQKPQAGSWAQIGSRVEVGVVQAEQTPPRSEITWVLVPNLFGQEEKTAEDIIRRSGLSVGKVSTGSASVPAGTVFAQAPLADAKVVQGTPVSLQVAQTPPPPTMVAVPNLINQGLENAKTLLARAGLQLGQVTQEPSEATVNSVTAQSPDAGMRVEPGTSVNVVIAQAIPMVAVPNIVQHPEDDAIAILRNAGLQLGAVTEREADASSGTILTQNPRAGDQVRTGATVDAVLSRQIVRQLTVVVNQAKPVSNTPLVLHAHLDPLRDAQYQFSFGDGKDSGWLKDSTTTHVYRDSGQFQVKAVATFANTTLPSETVTVTVISPFPWKTVAALAAGVLLLCGGGFLYRGRRLFRRWIRVVPKTVAGRQELSFGGGERQGQSVGIQLVQDAGQTTLELKRK